MRLETWPEAIPPPTTTTSQNSATHLRCVNTNSAQRRMPSISSDAVCHIGWVWFDTVMSDRDEGM
jgi:hypothetical protein